MRRVRLALALLAASVLAVPPSPAAEVRRPGGRRALAKALKDVKFSLQKGLSTSAREGRPISAKYEVEQGKLQLSVYTMKGDTFSEVIVGHRTGKVGKVDAIASGDDLTAAKAQSGAMAKAKRSLDAAASEAVKENKGFRVVSVMPALKDGHPVADVPLVKGSDWKTVSEKLD